MKVKLLEIRDAGLLLVKILNNPIDVKLAYRINKIAKKFAEELKLIEEARVKLVNEKYGEKQKDKDGKELESKIVPQKNMEAFIKEWESFLDTETDLPVQKIPFECLEGIKISAIEMSTLVNFIEEPKEEKSEEKK